MTACLLCGAAFDRPSGTGRPRSYCLTCTPSHDKLGQTRAWRARNRAALRETKRLAYRAAHALPLLVCSFCSAEFTPRRTDARYCSALCKNKAQARREWQAIGHRGFPNTRPSQRLAICERDGWRCGLCRAVIDPALKWPHPGSASLDHVDPLGPHEPANWQAAHLACNVQAGRKGLRVAS